MAAARRRVVYAVARNLIVLFVCDSRLVVVIPARRLRGARFLHFQLPGVVHQSNWRRTRRTASDEVFAPEIPIPSKHPLLAWHAA
jgi:hypothetical protein